MDISRGFEDETAVPAAPDEEPVMERPPEIGVDERRMHVRAYNYWVSLLAGRAYPAIQDVDPHNIEDFGPHSVLLDFSRDAEDPERIAASVEGVDEWSIPGVVVRPVGARR